MSAPKKLVSLGFEKDCKDIPLELLFSSKTLPSGIEKSVKYQQIRTSVSALGLVEPIVVAPANEDGSRYMVLDGHLRVEALRDLGLIQARCLISKDDESYTYNKRVNRLSVIQEHKMIVKAVDGGTPIEQLVKSLGLSADAIKQRFKLLDGICPEAIALLAEKPATRGMFNVLRQMKPFRQMDVAQAMINLNNYSLKLALAMLNATSSDQLIEKAAVKAQGNGASDTLRRLERELAAVQADTKLLEESYGPANLQLTIIKTHIKNLLDNVNVVKWLAKSNSEYLHQLQIIADIKHLPID